MPILRRLLLAVAIGLLALTATAPALRAAPDFLGNIFAGEGNSMTSDSLFPTYWDQFSPENAGKWGVVEPNRDTMRWGAFDQMMTFAGTNNLATKGHTLVWFQQAPTWISSLSATDLTYTVRKSTDFTSWSDLTIDNVNAFGDLADPNPDCDNSSALIRVRVKHDPVTTPKLFLRLQATD